MHFHKVAVLYGGDSSEREVSLQSGEAVATVLKKAGLNIYLFDPSCEPLENLKKIGVEVVFNLLHGGWGENGEIQAALHMLGISQTGSKAKACMLAFDKYLTKLIWQSIGLKTAPFSLIREEGDLNKAEALGFPLFLKPLTEGSSVGVRKVKSKQELIQEFSQLKKQHPVLIAEEFLNGGEYSCAIVGETALPVIKIEPTNEFYDYESKYLRNDTRYLCPALLTEQEGKIAQSLAKSAFASVGGEGFGRVDFMRNAQGDFSLLEINMVPGMTSHSLMPMAAKVAGLSFQELCLRILSYAS